MGDNEFAKFKKVIELEAKIIVFDCFGKDVENCYSKKQIIAKRKLYQELILKFRKIIIDKTIAYNNIDGFEKLKKSKKQQIRYPTLDIFRYEVRKFSNLRCIFVIDSESEYIFLLGAFNEDKSKSKRS